VSRLHWVDVFADRPLAGNPLAVVLDGDGVETARMQAVATELGLSETVFVCAAESAGAAARLRIFTPARELPLAGHPVVGAAWTLHAEGRMPARALLDTGLGPIEVRVEAGFATMVQAPPRALGAVDPGPVAAACGVRAPAAPPAPAAVWTTAMPQLMLAVDGVEELARARPDGEAIAALGAAGGWLGVSIYAIEEAAPGRAVARVRHFAPALGVLEDPVTGSAAGALGACLAAAGLGAEGRLELTVRQGAEMGRPGTVAVGVLAPAGAPERVEVGGRVTPVLSGHLTPAALGLPRARTDG
jgi:trans-2,3-dihydro-3-hydroxyanthranilate isomerase